MTAKYEDCCQPLFIYDDLTIDKHKRMVIATAPKGRFDRIELCIHIDKVREAYFPWNEKPIVFDVVDGYAQLYLEIGTQEIGCILVEY